MLKRIWGGSRGGNRGEPKHVHTCSVCGREGFWDWEWMWFGSIKQYEDRPESIVKTCSRKCALAHRATLPFNAPAVPSLAEMRGARP